MGDGRWLGVKGKVVDANAESGNFCDSGERR